MPPTKPFGHYLEKRLEKDARNLPDLVVEHLNNSNNNQNNNTHKKKKETKKIKNV